MSDQFTRMKIGPSRRRFLKTLETSGDAALIRPSIGMGEAFAQGANDACRCASHAARTRHRIRCRVSDQLTR
jgi:hypothetical protein